MCKEQMYLPKFLEGHLEMLPDIVRPEAIKSLSGGSEQTDSVSSSSSFEVFWRLAPTSPTSLSLMSDSVSDGMRIGSIELCWISRLVEASRYLCSASPWIRKSPGRLAFECDVAHFEQGVAEKKKEPAIPCLRRGDWSSSYIWRSYTRLECMRSGHRPASQNLPLHCEPRLSHASRSFEMSRLPITSDHEVAKPACTRHKSYTWPGACANQGTEEQHSLIAVRGQTIGNKPVLALPRSLWERPCMTSAQILAQFHQSGTRPSFRYSNATNSADVAMEWHLVFPCR